ncbi:glycosyltransferase [Nocardiopsis composta]
MHGATEPADVLSRPLPDGLPPGARDWFARRTYTARTWDEERIRELKGGTRVSVVLPARDESATVGEIVSAIRGALVSGPAPVVDEIIVIDSHSSDGTARIAEKAGALVVHQDDVRPDLPRGAARATRCGSRWPWRPATSRSSWTPTSATSPRATSPGCSGRCWRTRGSPM